MQLNIYILSHPIIKLLSNSINININQKQKNSYLYRYVGTFLIYEITRGYLHTKPIYIKQILHIKQMSLLDKNTNYYIITDLIQTFNLIGDIKIILPSIKILNINNKKQENFQNTLKELNNHQHINKHIIILEIILSEIWIIKLIKSLRDDYEIPIKNIHITSLACYNQILEQLGKEYPKVNIYTTKII
uniref:Phosphoribosyltransferase domain-containing protein n=1 Tax=Nitophyllum punctatum TaxID=158729 RepID=A0A4D6WW36_9FLOR|nr:hypothetical protein [Nitophyllum punctatum]